MIEVKYSVLTWLLIILGWVVVHYLNVTRDRQKDSRDIKERLIDEIIDLEKSAIAFHQNAQHDSQKAIEILSTIQRISSTLRRAPLSLLSLEDTYVKDLRRSITLRNFDPSKFIQQTHGSRIIVNINLAVENIISAIEEKFSARYLTKWWQIFRN